MRLDKYLSNATDYSRSQVKKLVREGRVTVNGEPASDAARATSAADSVALDEVLIAPPGKRYIMFNKPAGVVSATKDSEHPTAIDYLDEPRAEQLQIAGRLDIDATGLLLITDDGQWNHRVTSPPSSKDGAGCTKIYRVELAEPLQPALVDKFAAGIWLEGEKRRTLPADLRILDEHTARLGIREGKYHQVKRMFAALGNYVEALHRESIGAIVLDEYLAPGEYRALTRDEVASI